MDANLYVHFPFCRSRCSYCTLFSRAGVGAERRREYAKNISAAISKLDIRAKTVYFGGGSPGFCDLGPVLDALDGKLAEDCEFTVELHPLDVSDSLLETLRSGGVNRISMGVQSLDDGILAHMKRGYGFYVAERAFAAVKNVFDNAGIDLIAGYPGETVALSPRHARLAKWGLRHCSVYALQNDRALAGAADDATAMDRIAILSRFLGELGLERYEISNYAVPGFECRHNLAVWRGEDYIGLGEGAYGRIGRRRTPSGETVSEERDRKERTIFRLRTRDGLDSSVFPEWTGILERFEREGLLSRDGTVWRLTERGTEVCDSILAELV